jgi:hypothetical protein
MYSQSLRCNTVSQLQPTLIAYLFQFSQVQMFLNISDLHSLPILRVNISHTETKLS